MPVTLRHDDEGRIRQAGAIPMRAATSGRIEVLLVRRRGRRGWMIPKGLVDPGLDEPAAAAAEALEEAGVRGTVIEPPIGAYEYEKFGGTCRVRVFALLVDRVEPEEAWLESSLRERRWFAEDEASGAIRRDDVATLVAPACAQVRTRLARDDDAGGSSRTEATT